MAEMNNLFGEEISMPKETKKQNTNENTSKEPRTKIPSNKKVSAVTSCREKLLAEYMDESWDVKSKLSKYDDGGTYLPLSEKIRMFRSDFPDGAIECSILIDNNIFATVQCKITCSIGNVTAVAKWYHNNNDKFGMNYVGTAQSNAVSSALRLLGYDAGSEAEAPPLSNVSEVELLPPPETLNFNNSAITEGNAQPIARKNDILTFEQCKTIAINNPPFSGKTVGEILDTKFMLNEFYALMRYFVEHKCVLSDAAKIILKETNGEKIQNG